MAPTTFLTTRPTLAEWVKQLGNLPLERIAAEPFPGTATPHDLLQIRHATGKLYELVDDTLVEKDMGSPESFLAMELVWRLRSYLAAHDFGFLYGPDALFALQPNLIRGPDISFVPWTRRPEPTVPHEPISRDIPALVVEILSPVNTDDEIQRKIHDYHNAGVELIWIIDPHNQTATVYHADGTQHALQQNDTLDGAEVLPGFQLPLPELFARLQPPANPRPGESS